MRLSYGFTADAAQFTSDGRLFTLGADFDTIFVQEFPATHPTMSLVIKLVVKPTECDREHNLRVELLSADGEQVYAPIVLPFTPQANLEQPHRDVGVGLVVNYVNVPLPSSADYGFHVLVDDLELADIPLYVAQAPPLENP